MRRFQGRTMLTELHEIVDPRRTALLLVDMQNDFCADDGWFGHRGFDLSGVKAAEARLVPLLDAARRAGVMPVHIQMRILPGLKSISGACMRFLADIGRIMDTSGEAFTTPGTWGAEAVGSLAPLPGEAVVEKWRSSAFTGTNLDMVLRCMGIETVICTGVATHACVDSTARDATFHDYYTVVVRDCVDGYGGELHDKALELQAHRMDMVDSAPLIGLWDRAGSAAQAAQ